MKPKKLTVREQKEIFPDECLRQAFIQRADISILTPDEQNKRWLDAKKKIESFMGFLSDIPAYVVKGE